MSATAAIPETQVTSDTVESLAQPSLLDCSITTEQLYQRYADRIRGLVRRAMSHGLASRIEPDDIVQSVFRRFFQAVDQGRYDLPTGEELDDLLVAITLNRLRSAEVFHRAAMRDLRQTVSGDELIGVKGPDSMCGFDPALSLAVTDLIERLSPEHRQVVSDRMDGYEVAEIASRMGRSKRSVERMLQEVRTCLRNLLEPDNR